MKFKITFFLIFLFFFSCSPHYTKLSNKEPYNTQGLAYIYNEKDFKDKIINKRLNNSLVQVSHRSIKPNALIKLINPKTKESIVVKNLKNSKYPELYKIIITETVAKKLSISPSLPLVEILEIKKNKSFIAKKAKIFSEEKKISTNAPVTSVQISNISEKNQIKKKEKQDKIYILIASFYSKDVAVFLKKRIMKEMPNYDMKKLIVKKKNNKKINLISGPYKAVNLMKNDYILLKNFGFEELNIILDE